MLNLSKETKYIIKGEATTVFFGQKTLNLFGKVHYLIIIIKAQIYITLFYRNALKKKECYYGPFKGEFGHFLLHNLPFLTNLHKRGVKIHYCGMELHRPFLVDETGDSIIYKYYPLRDFFAEVPSRANETIPPKDVQEVIADFQEIAKHSRFPFFNIADKDMYWFVFRNWQLKKGLQSVYNLQKVYKTRTENSCVIFPRKKGNLTVTPNNGGPWDYMELARKVSPHFDKVYITGHPSMSSDVFSEGNIIAALSPDNKVILECCSNGNLIISQHSGAVHMGLYTNSDVLLIFNGSPPIKGLIDTLRFRKNLGTREIDFAFNIDEIVKFVSSRAK